MPTLLEYFVRKSIFSMQALRLWRPVRASWRLACSSSTMRRWFVIFDEMKYDTVSRMATVLIISLFS